MNCLKIKSLLVLLLMEFAVAAQIENDHKTKNLGFAKFAIGISPSAFLNIHSGVQISQDLRLNSIVNLTAESAYIFTGDKGYRFKVGLERLLHQSTGYLITIGANYTTRKTRVSNESRQKPVGPFTTSQYNYESAKEVLLNGVEVNGTLVAKVNERMRLQVGLGIGAGSKKTQSFFHFQATDGFFFFPVAPFFGETEEYDHVVRRNSRNFTLITSLNLNFSYVIAT